MQPPTSLSNMVPSLSSMLLPAPRYEPNISFNTFGIGFGLIGVPQKLIILAIAANSAIAAFSLDNTLSIFVCAINSSKAASACVSALYNSGGTPESPNTLPKLIFKHNCRLGSLIPPPANKLQIISRKLTLVVVVSTSPVPASTLTLVTKSTLVFFK